MISISIWPHIDLSSRDDPEPYIIDSRGSRHKFSLSLEAGCIPAYLGTPSMVDYIDRSVIDTQTARVRSRIFGLHGPIICFYFCHSLLRRPSGLEGLLSVVNGYL